MVNNANEPTQAQEMGSLLRVAAVCTALCLGCAVASLQALAISGTQISFHFSFGTLAAFAAGFVAALLYWKFAIRDLKARHQKAAVLVMAVFGVAMFLYPLRFVPKEKRHEIAIGLGTAAIALSLVGFLLWRLMRFLNADADEADRPHE